jgi:hypothetical protein
MKDAGIEFKQVLYPYDHTWPKISQVLQQQGTTRTGQLPAVEYQGMILIQVCCTTIVAAYVYKVLTLLLAHSYSALSRSRPWSI